MLKQSIELPVQMEAAPPSEQLFPAEREYGRCVINLNRTAILTYLPKSDVN
jgi:hypothetical protein